jgi:hypothetical protein
LNLIGAPALVPDDGAHVRRLSDDAEFRPRGLPLQAFDKASHADAAQFLIIGKRNVHGPLERCLSHFGNEREHAGEKALHVAGAPAIETLVSLAQLKGIDAPSLAVNRNRVGVA